MNDPRSSASTQAELLLGELKKLSAQGDDEAAAFLPVFEAFLSRRTNESASSLSGH